MAVPLGVSKEHLWVKRDSSWPSWSNCGYVYENRSGMVVKIAMQLPFLPWLGITKLYNSDTPAFRKFWSNSCISDNPVCWYFGV